MKIPLYRWGLFLLSFLISLAPASYSASPAPTQEQWQQFQQMSPAERETLLRSLKREAQTRSFKGNGIAPTGKAAPGVSDASGPQPEESAAITVVEPGALQPPRLKAGDTVLIRFSRDLLAPLDTSTPEIVSPKIYIPEQKLFVLDQFGAITLEKTGRIILKGLNEVEAAERIGAEPTFKGWQVTVKLLPVEEPLKPFGYDLFTGNAKTFAPGTDIPIPADYIVGPNDTVLVQLFGKENAQHELVITRDGDILFPGIGPIQVAGLTFAQMERQIQNRVQKQLIGMKASVTLGQLRSIRVFVLGDAEQPGSYIVSGLSTLTNALLTSGGVKRIGSLRDIQLKRKGKIVSRMDLYDLLLRGDNRADARLQSGDVIFIPSIGKTAGIAGRVRRPAIYELKDEKTVNNLITMAGGLAPDAYPQGAKIERIMENHERSLLGVDLTREDVKNTELRDGDVVKIYSVLDQLRGVVKLAGQVQRTGEYQWKPEMRLTQLIPSVSDLLPQADARYLLIKREDALDHSITFLDTDLIAALEKPESETNVLLQPRDEVHAFDVRADRETLIRPLLEQARARSAPDKPVSEVVIEGVVHHPGRYPLSSDMKISNLLRAAGGLTDRAYTLEAELTRFAVVDGKEREQSRQVVDMAAVLKNEQQKDITLKPHDQLVIRRIPKWGDEGVIEIAGEVKFPGRYPIARDEKLSDVIKRAGGLTEQAFPKGAIFLREIVRAREQEHLDRLATQLERDLAILSAQTEEIGVKKEAAIVEGQALLRQLRAVKAAGRTVINLDTLLQGRESDDVTVQTGDRLYIPQRPQEVTVLGEVYYPTSHLYDSKLTVSDYLKRSGGVSEKGNKSAMYVVRADGSVSPPTGWFGREAELGPGDTIVVPLKVDRVSGLKLFSDVSTILFQLAVTVAALDAIGVF
jgi:protein involved in polysaccharide export with SLBB domain